MVWRYFSDEDRRKALETIRRKAAARKELERKEVEAEAARIAHALDTMRLPDFFTPPQVAAIFRVTPKCVREWVRKGKLKAYDFYHGGHMRIPSSEVERLRKSAQ